jgi:hypothetical protein
VAQERLARVLSVLGSLNADQGTSWSRVCVVCAEVLGVGGAAIVFMPDGAPPGALGVSDLVAAALEEAQFTLGEGPGVAAVRDRRPVHEPDLGAASATSWPAFADRALQLHVQAVFALPLQVGAALLGSLTLHRRDPGLLSDEQYADALAIAELVSYVILAMQAHAPPGRLADELEWYEGKGLRARVHQASGVISAQLDIGVADALVRLRAYAYAQERSVDEVAVEVMAGTLRFDDGAD